VELAAQTRQFMDQVASLLEMMGINRSCGRMFGLLLVADRPLSLDEIAATLGMSKPSVSANTRLYERLRLLQRVHVPGDRKHYYEILPGAFEQTAAARIAVLHSFVQLSEAGLRIVEKDNEIARARLHEMAEFYRHLARAMEHAIEAWDADHPTIPNA
jgi:DNA-binding transcriptional regulator GbsR (MarR family)